MKQDVIVLNCGSSSIKFAIIDALSGESQFSGLAENLGNHDARIKTKHGDTSHTQALPSGAHHDEALLQIQALISEQQANPVAVGHRVVHGGERFTSSVLITEEVKQAIRDTSHMAPLHNPANLAGIESAQQAFSHLPQIAVFDTAFFQTMPEKAWRYALPRALYDQHGIRRYGFHGSSHLFVSRQSATLLNQPLEQLNVITAHLGNGCSIAAIKQGKAVDTSLGFTPLEGLVMGTRCGDLDPSLPGVLINQFGYSADEVDTMLNKHSGLAGISGLSNDCRTLEEAAQQGNAHAQMALEIFCYRLAKYIGSYMVVTGKLDALVFTGGIGENSSWIRKTVLNQLQHMGFECDPAMNTQARFGQSGQITAAGTPVLVIPTNEEWVIAEDAARISQSTQEV